MAGGKVFINYRRDDSRADSGRLYDRLNARYPGRVFRDVGSLEPGVEWHEAIEKVLGSSDACVVVIGKEWLSIASPAGKRRLDDPKDTVRQEIVTAIKRGMRVFPVLVGGGKMPAEEDLPEELQALARRNALEITEQDWDQGFEKLAEALDRILGGLHPPPFPPPRKTSNSKPIVLGALGLVVAVVIVIAVYNATQKPPVTVIREDPAGSGAASSINGTGNGPSDNPKPEPARSSSVSNSLRTREVPAESSVQPVSSGSEPPPVISEPQRPQFNPSQLVGNWRAVVTQEGQQVVESVDLFPDYSFGVTFNGAAAAVGRWQYNAADNTVDVVNGVNFMTNGTKFVCKLNFQSAASFAGSCLDQSQATWNSAITRAGGIFDEVDSIPRVNVSALSLAEKQAFAQVLGLSRCTCGCGMSIIECLHKDPNCNVSPALAQTQLATFLSITRR